MPEFQGEPETIAAEKCKAACAAIGHNGPVVTEDTCLCFDAMDGLPGPYIKWFLKALGCDGLVKMLAAFANKEAAAQCTFAYCAGPHATPKTFVGRVAGRIVEPRGDGKFGWDPIFMPLCSQKT